MDRRELAQRKKRIGRKALATVRVAISIERKLETGKSEKKKFQFHYEFRKKHLLIAGGVVVLAIAGVVAFKLISAQVSAQMAADAARQQKIEEAALEERNACREKITAQKVDQLGSITYDELYNGQCR